MLNQRLRLWFPFLLLGLGVVLESLLVTSQENHRHRASHPAGLLSVRWGDTTTKIISCLTIAFVLAAFAFAVERQWFVTGFLVLGGALLVALEWWHDLPWPQRVPAFWLGLLIGGATIMVSAIQNIDFLRRTFHMSRRTTPHQTPPATP